jgi:hypothetical protein
VVGVGTLKLIQNEVCDAGDNFFIKFAMHASIC